MHRMVESAKPVFGMRTRNVSIALAITHVLNRRNSSKSAGAGRFELIGGISLSRGEEGIYLVGLLNGFALHAY